MKRHIATEARLKLGWENLLRMPSGEISPNYPIYTGEEDEDYADLFSIEEVYGGATSMDAMGKDQRNGLSWTSRRRPTRSYGSHAVGLSSLKFLEGQ